MRDDDFLLLPFIMLCFACIFCIINALIDHKKMDELKDINRELERNLNECVIETRMHNR